LKSYPEFPGLTGNWPLEYLKRFING
jgi:hypothetical protein